MSRVFFNDGEVSKTECTHVEQIYIVFSSFVALTASECCYSFEKQGVNVMNIFYIFLFERIECMALPLFES